MGIWYCALFVISHPKTMYFSFRNAWFPSFSAVLVPSCALRTSSIRNSVETVPEFDFEMALRTQRSARQSCKFYRWRSWPLVFSSNRVRHWERHLACETQVALNDTALLVSEISVFDKYHTTYLACVHVYVGCETMLMNIPKKVLIIIASRKCDMIPKNTPFR